MNQELVKAFKNDKFGNVRVVLIGESQEPYFVGKDVAECLGYSDTKSAISDHVDAEDKQIIQKGQIATLEIPNRGLTVINESGLYSLILSSKLPQAKEFKRWVTSEVLPSIRKTGTYSTGQKPMSIEDAIIESMKLQKELKEQLNQVNCHALEAKAQSQEVKQEIEDMKDSMPLFKVECDDLVSMVKKKATHILGGYKSNAYNDKSILQRVYKDIYAQINREFGVEKCSGIKRKDFDIAKQFVEDYKAPMVLVQDINLANSQTTLFDKKEEQGA